MGKLRRVQVMFEEELFKKLQKYCNRRAVKEGRYNIMSMVVREAVKEFLKNKQD